MWHFNVVCEGSRKDKKLEEKKKYFILEVLFLYQKILFKIKNIYVLELLSFPTNQNVDKTIHQ